MANKKLEEKIEMACLGKEKSNYTLIACLHSTKERIIDFEEKISLVIKEVIKKSNLNLVRGKELVYRFKPYGVTALYILKQSHIAIHTWPEKEFVRVDIFSCSGKKYAKKAYEEILKVLEPSRVEKVEIYG
ncbi:MAG: adenosylmethionine decarboxylase [Candidatus Pacearchaeota archaeon]